MSRVGKKIIQIPDKVEVKIDGDLVMVKGPKGELKQKMHPWISLEMINKEIFVKVKDELNKKQRSVWGTSRQLIDNMIKGVTTGFEKKLEINGVGYKAEVKGKTLVLSVGYSHPVNFEIPTGIQIEEEKNVMTITGADKYVIGETAAQTRKVRKPEPYKGKGIKYETEVIRRKAGKQIKGAAA
jgi:large subunit ribosomal protein L6